MIDRGRNVMEDDAIRKKAQSSEKFEEWPKWKRAKKTNNDLQTATQKKEDEQQYCFTHKLSLDDFHFNF